MRRGLIGWSKEEVPPAVLEERVARVQQAMRDEGLDAVIAYTSFAQPSAVQWLTHFVPYWSEALAVVLPTGMPVLLASLTQRVHPWIREVSYLADVRSAPRLGESAASFLRDLATGDDAGKRARVGVIGLDMLPWSVGKALFDEVGADAFHDFGDTYAALRQPADEAEISLARRALTIGKEALASIPADASRAAEVLAAVEFVARNLGAEEVLQRIAPDYRQDPTLRRMEGDAALGPCFALELSLAYKGAWVRLTHCGLTDAEAGPPASWAHAEAWFAAQTAAAGPSLSLAAPPGGTLKSWRFEACSGSSPLSVIVSQDQRKLGALGVLSVECEFPDGPWRASAAVVLGQGALRVGTSAP